MKHILLIVIFFSLKISARGQSTPAEMVADKIALKIRDSLQLTDTVRQQIKAINLQLHDAKQQVWQQYSLADSVKLQVQLIENTRDSLYQQVIPPPKFPVYLDKKKNLVSND